MPEALPNAGSNTQFVISVAVPACGPGSHADRYRDIVRVASGTRAAGMRAACAHAPRAWRARGGAPLLAFGMTWDGMGGTGMTWGVLNAAPLRERRITPR